MANGEAATTRRSWQLAAIAAIVSAIVVAASLTPAWRLVELKVFDYFSTIASPPLPAESPISVAIDEPSMSEIGRRWPWPRNLHGALVEALRSAGAKAIGFDIIFAEPSTVVASDQALAATLGP